MLFRFYTTLIAPHFIAIMPPFPRLWHCEKDNNGDEFSHFCKEKVATLPLFLCKNDLLLKTDALQFCAIEEVIDVNPFHAIVVLMAHNQVLGYDNLAE